MDSVLTAALLELGSGDGSTSSSTPRERGIISRTTAERGGSEGVLIVKLGVGNRLTG